MGLFPTKCSSISLFGSGMTCVYNITPTIDLPQLSNIGFDFRQNRQCSWEKRLKDLIAYKAENGGNDPTRSVKYRGVQLGSWCSAQRICFRKGTLEQTRIDRLQEAGFNFVSLGGEDEQKMRERDSIYQEWEKMFRKAIGFYESEHMTIICVHISNHPCML